MQSVETESAYLTYAQAARYCNVHATTIWRALKRDELVVAGPGRAVRFHRDELDRWMNSRNRK